VFLTSLGSIVKLLLACRPRNAMSLRLSLEPQQEE